MKHCVLCNNALIMIVIACNLKIKLFCHKFSIISCLRNYFSVSFLIGFDEILFKIYIFCYYNCFFLLKAADALNWIVFERHLICFFLSKQFTLIIYSVLFRTVACHFKTEELDRIISEKGNWIVLFGVVALTIWPQGRNMTNKITFDININLCLWHKIGQKERI